MIMNFFFFFFGRTRGELANRLSVKVIGKLGRSRRDLGASRENERSGSKRLIKGKIDN